MRSNPEVAIGGLGNRRDRTARQAGFPVPHVNQKFALRDGSGRGINSDTKDRQQSPRAYRRLAALKQLVMWNDMLAIISHFATEQT